MASGNQPVRQAPAGDAYFRNIPLNDTGMVQFFYHSPSSKLPIRDVLGEQGGGSITEPHIECGAHNYWHSYCQDRVRSFAGSDKKYLFLMTTCNSRELARHYKKRSIVGYIEKTDTGKNLQNVNGMNVQFVKGKAHLYSFDDAFPFPINIPTKNMSREETGTILYHFNKCDDILNDCIQEIIRLDKDNLTCMRVGKGKTCMFRDECRRWNKL